MNTERPIVAKIGGESQTTPDGCRVAMRYLQSNQDIHYLVPSAIGGDPKVTHLLIACAPEWEDGHLYNDIYRNVRKQYPSTDEIFGEIRRIYTSMGDKLGYHGIGPLLDQVEALVITASRSESEIEKERYRHLVVSRGEWLSGHMWSELLDWRFVDPAELIMLRKDGRLNERSYNLIENRLRGGDRFVIPGFFGRGADGTVRLLPKNGSDLTGAFIARGVYASEYQNLKNVDGVMSADPNIVGKKAATLISRMTYSEYGELGYGGFQVLHKDSMVPVAAVGIPVRVLNPELLSLNSEYKGTLICASRSDIEGRDVIGIAGKKGYATFRIHKEGMESNKGIARRILQIIERNGISISHPPTGYDFISVVFEERQLVNNRADKIMEELASRIRPEELTLERGLGTFAVVGQGIRAHRTQVASKLLLVLDGASINFLGGTQDLNGISMTYFVKEEKFKAAVIATHKALIEDCTENK